jgi:hypothetical protein
MNLLLKQAEGLEKQLPLVVTKKVRTTEVEQSPQFLFQVTGVQR